MRLHLILAGAALLFVSARACQAQSNVDHFFAVQCVPELSYLSIRNFSLGSIPVDLSRKGTRRALGTKYGIHPISDLRAGVIKCELPGHKIEISGEYQAATFHGECGDAEKAVFSLTVDGEKVVDFAEWVLGGCEAIRVLVEVDAESARLCTTNIADLVWGDKQASNQPNECKVVKRFPS